MPAELFLKFVKVIIISCCGFLRCLGVALVCLFRILPLLLLLCLVDVDCKKIIVSIKLNKSCQ